MIKKNQTDYSLFGLPEKVEFCKKCLNSNQRPTTRAEHLINEDITIPVRFFDGVCEACVIKDKKQMWIGKKENTNSKSY